jgi:hypothetical protein
MLLYDAFLSMVSRCGRRNGINELGGKASATAFFDRDKADAEPTASTAPTFKEATHVFARIGSCPLAGPPADLR